MPLVQTTSVSKSYGGVLILAGVTFALEPGEKVALVGRNGAGKTTLLRVVAGLEPPDEGAVAVSGGAVVGYLPQDPAVDQTRTLWDEAGASFEPLAAAERRLAELEAQLATSEVHGDDARLAGALEEYGRLRDQFETRGGFTYEAEIRRTLTGLEFREDQFRQTLATMSGGQRSRAALARLLLSGPDLLLLDEPTNHLDLDGLEWLEVFLQQYRGAVLLVSHDRYLLDTVTTRTLDLEDGRLEEYPGNYTYYTTERIARRARQQEAFERQQEEIQDLKAYIRRYHAGQKSRQAKSREKRLARIQPVEAPRTHRVASIHLEAPRRTPQIVLRLRNVAKRFGQLEVLRGATLEIHRGEKIGLIGPNGAGKTTLLRIIAGAESPTSGTVDLAPGVRIGYFAQHSEEALDLDSTVLDEVLGNRSVTPTHVRTLLGRFLFTKDDVHKKVGQLSGGERRRLALAKVILDRPDVLLLDEPTTHFDLTTLEALDAALRAFAGAIIFVSHDRYLLDRLAAKLLVLRDGSLTSVPGPYHEYRQALAGSAGASNGKPRGVLVGGDAVGGAGKKIDAPSGTGGTPPKEIASLGAHPRRPGGRTGAERRSEGPSADEIMTQISGLERELSDLSRAMGDPELYRDATRARDTVKRYEEATTTLATLYAALEGLEGQSHA